MGYYTIRSDEMYHHGILGQKWGIRRYQNADGSLTAAGREHYGVGEAKEATKKYDRVRPGKAYDSERKTSDGKSFNVQSVGSKSYDRMVKKRTKAYSTKDTRGSNYRIDKALAKNERDKIDSSAYDGVRTKSGLLISSGRLMFDAKGEKDRTRLSRIQSISYTKRGQQELDKLLGELSSDYHIMTDSHGNYYILEKRETIDRAYSRSANSFRRREN